MGHSGEGFPIRPPTNPYISVPLMLGVAAVAGYWIILALVDFAGLRTLWAGGALFFALLALTMWIVRYHSPGR